LAEVPRARLGAELASAAGMRIEWQLTKLRRLAFTGWILAFGLAGLAALMLLNRYIKLAGPPWPSPWLPGP
jgi:hypothetical protein